MKMIEAPAADHAIQTRFANLAGEIAESFAFSRSIGQIYGFLYLNSSPVSLNDIANALGMSKGNASVNLRTLEDWGAVKPVWVKGSRRDYYEANRDLEEIIKRRIEEGLAKRVQKIESSISKLNYNLENNKHNENESSKFIREGVSELEKFLKLTHKALILLPKLKKFI